MPQISLTDLVDIVSKSGTPKASKVAQVKVRPDYAPAFDFYKQLRDRIIKIHRENGDKRELHGLLTEVADRKRRANYPAVVDGYKKWWGRKNLSWFDPIRDTYSHAGVNVIINPELGLEVNGERHLIKLYFKTDPLSKFRVDIITYLMETALRRNSERGTVMSVLDMRRSKLYSLDSGSADHSAIVNAELAYIASLWDNI